MTNATVGAGLIHFALRRATNIHWQALDVNKRRARRSSGQKPGVLWFTGLSGAGKSTIANLVEKRLHALGHHTYLLDGDNVRHGLNRDLGFTDADRVENIRRVAEVGKADGGRRADRAGLVHLAFRPNAMARELVEEGEFIEVFVDTPLDDAAGATRRDSMPAPRGRSQFHRHRRALRGSRRCRPTSAFDTTAATAEELAERVIEDLRRRAIIV